MDNNIEATTTQRGRQTRTPAKFNQNGSLGAAVGGGGLLPTSQKLLPGITGTTTEGAATTNTHSEGGAGCPRKVATTAVPTTASPGKAHKTRAQELMAVLRADPAFADDDDEQARGSNKNKSPIASHNSCDVESSSDDDSFSMGAKDDDLEMGRGSSGSSLRENVGGSSRRSDSGSPTGSGSDVASAGAPVSATTVPALLTLQKSIDRNRTKCYHKWPASLLREACSLRKIMGFSREKDTGKMANRLEQLDLVMERSSPFLADLDDKVAGGTPASQPLASAKETEEIPEELMIATKAAVGMGASFEKRKLLAYNGRSYPAAAVLAAIEAAKDGEGGDEDIGARRKSKHCVPRFCEVVAMNLELWFGHRSQLSKAELDNKLTSKTRSAMVRLWEQFKDDKVEVPCTFADDEHVLAAGINPNVVHQPNITFDKFTTMKNDIIKDHGDMHVNYKKSGSNGEMYSFCKGSLDTYYYGLMCEKYPGIEQASSQMLPEGMETENTGVGGLADQESGVEGAAAHAKRRAAAKRDSKERNATLGGQNKKKKKQVQEIENAAKVAASAAKEELGLGAGLGSLLGMSSGPSYSDAPTSFYDTIEGCENRNKKLEYSASLRKSLADIKADIRREKALGDDADLEDIQIMEAELTKVRAARKKASADAL